MLQPPPSNLYIYIYKIQTCRWILYPLRFLQVHIYLTTGTQLHRFMWKKKKITDTITSTGKKKYFKFILCTTKLLQDIPVKERCNMRQYPQGWIKHLPD